MFEQLIQLSPKYILTTKHQQGNKIKSRWLKIMVPTVLCHFMISKSNFIIHLKVRNLIIRQSPNHNNNESEWNITGPVKPHWPVSVISSNPPALNSFTHRQVKIYWLTAKFWDLWSGGVTLWFLCHLILIGSRVG